MGKIVAAIFLTESLYLEYRKREKIPVNIKETNKPIKKQGVRTGHGGARL